MSRLRFLAVAALLSGALLLPACGGVAADTESKPSAAASNTGDPAALRIEPTSLPAGRQGAEYPATSLQATPADVAVWDVTAGSLPPGMGLSANGLLSGAPTTEGVFGFTVRARTDSAVATRAFAIPVGVFTVEVEGLVLGRAWSETPVTLLARGASGAVTFAAAQNASGGRFLAASPAAGSASWSPGASGEPGATDRLVATDATGATAEVVLSVMPHPSAHHVAEFGTTDVWYVDDTRKLGSHGFATDMQEALARVGLRAPTSHDLTGTMADRLAEYLVRRQILRELNLRFLREADGRAGLDGLPVSFPMERPVGYECAAPSSWLSGAPHRFSSIGIHAGRTQGIMGMAFLDDGRNEVHENNTTSPVAELGVFVNQFVTTFLYAYGDPEIDGHPVTDADVAALEALLYDLPSPGGRHAALSARIHGFARTLADTTAHEVAHSLGVPHTSPRVSGSLMNTGLFIGPTFHHAFRAEDVQRLRGALPGVGRTGGSSVSKPVGFPAGGVEASLCVMRVQVPDARPLPAWAVPAR